MAEIRLKRAYEKPEPYDGLRILVERLWPRGLTKDRAAIDLWMKEIAPSPELRKWYGHDTKPSGPSFKSATGLSSVRIKSWSRSCARNAGVGPSRLFMLRATKSATVRSC